MDNRGTLVISLDFELLWGFAGWNEKQIKNYKANICGAADALRRILDMFRRYDIKCTIAFVGGMNCDSSDDFLEKAPALRPHYGDNIYSSYESLIPYVRKHDCESLLFCRGLIDELAHNPLVELASHTFSHYYCLEEGQKKEEFESDVITANGNAAYAGIGMETIIFPRNQVSEQYLEVCARHGFTHYRGNLENFLYRSEKTPARFSLRRVLRLLDTYVNISGYNCYPHAECGRLTNVPASRFMRPYSAGLRMLEPLRIRRITRSVAHAAKCGEVYHLWWHPHNFGINTDRNIDGLDILCRHYRRMAEEYGMRNKFIGEM